jgi:hypothetical protein
VSNTISPWSGGLGELLRRVIVDDRHFGVPEIATALDLTPRGLLAKLQRGARFSPDQLVILLHELKDERLIRWLFAGSGLLVVERPDAPDDGLNTAFLQMILSSAMECAVALCELADVPETSAARRQSWPELLQHVERAQAELLRIRLHLATGGMATATAGVASPDGLAGLVSRILLTEVGVRPRDLAYALGLSYGALHARLTGHAAFLPDDLKRLFQSYPEPRIADYLLAGTRFVTIKRPVPGAGDGCYPPLRAGLKVLRALTGLSHRLLTGDVPGSRAETVVAQGVDDALRQPAVLHWSLTNFGHRPSGDSAERGGPRELARQPRESLTPETAVGQR